MTKEQFIVENYQTMPVAELAKKGKMGRKRVYDYLRANGLQPFISATCTMVSTKSHPWQVSNKSLIHYTNRNLNKNKV